MKQMKRKIISTLIVLLFAFAATIGSTYAYWNMLTQTENVTLAIGQGDEIVVNISTAGTGTLIPTSQTPTTGEVTSVVFEYEVSLNQQAVDASATSLAVVSQNVLIGGDGTYASLVNIAISGIDTLSTTAITVTVTVTITEPTTQVAYDAIFGQDITFDLVFTASA